MRCSYLKKSLSLFVLLPFSLMADQIVLPAQDFEFEVSPGHTNLVFDRFDTMGGTRVLDSVTLIASATLSGAASAENNSLGIGANVSVIFIGTLSLSQTPTSLNPRLVGSDVDIVESAQYYLSPSDNGGVANGSGTDYHHYGSLSGSVAVNEVLSASSVDLSGFTGPGSPINIFTSASASWNTSGTTEGTVTFSDLYVVGTAQIIYTYHTVPEPSSGLLAAGAVGLLTLQRRRRA